MGCTFLIIVRLAIGFKEGIASEYQETHIYGCFSSRSFLSSDTPSGFYCNITLLSMAVGGEILS
jgi:hypothetical protein